MRRLLAAQVHQTNDFKLVHYVSTMQDLLSTLTGDAAHQDLHESLLQTLKSMLGKLSLWLTNSRTECWCLTRWMQRELRLLLFKLQLTGMGRPSKP